MAVGKMEKQASDARYRNEENEDGDPLDERQAQPSRAGQPARRAMFENLEEPSLTAFAADGGVSHVERFLSGGFLPLGHPRRLPNFTAGCLHVSELLLDKIIRDFQT